MPSQSNKLPDNSAHINPGTLKPVQYSPVWITLFLILAVVFTGTALAVHYRMETFRGIVVSSISTWTGARVEVGTPVLLSSKGVQLRDLLVEYPFDGGFARVDAPSLYVSLEFAELLRGRISIAQVTLEGARVHLTLSPDALSNPFSPESFHGKAGRPFSGMALQPFELSGTGCALEIVGAEIPIKLSGVDFHVQRSGALSGMRVEGSGAWGAGSESQIRVEADVTSPSDFRMRFHADNMPVRDWSPVLPATFQSVQEGIIGLGARIESYPDRSVFMDLETTFQGILLPNTPLATDPLYGTASAQVRFDRETKLLSVSTMRFNADNLLSGTAQGSIDFAMPEPEVSGILEFDALPAQVVVDSLLQEHVDAMAGVTVTVERADGGTLSLSGPLKAPVLHTHIRQGVARVAFAPPPALSHLPSGELTVSLVEGKWDSEAENPVATLNIMDGTLRHAESGFSATAVTGHAVLEGTKVLLSTLTANVNKSPVIGSASYDYSEKKGEARISGSLSNLEDTLLKEGIRNVTLAGSVYFDLNARYDGNTFTFGGNLDASPAYVGYRWFFGKPQGVGMRSTVEGTFEPKKTLEWKGVLESHGSSVSHGGKLAHTGSRWRLLQTRADLQTVDVDVVGQCLSIPYKVNGGIVTSGSFAWNRDASPADQPDALFWNATFECAVDEVIVQSGGPGLEARCRDITVSAQYKNAPDKNTARLQLRAGDAALPPMGSDWIVPMRSTDPEMMQKFPPVPRDWTYTLHADAVSYPPWNGTGFAGEAYFNDQRGGLSTYTATVDGGTITGNYHRDRIENAFTTETEWSGVPASYFLRHMKLPEFLRGSTEGQITYSQDRDDPVSTLEGQGHFMVIEGSFNADYVLGEFGEHFSADVGSGLPPFLQFTLLESEVQFQGDRVMTPRLHLVSEGLDMQASGGFVRHGDLDYDLQVSISPETAVQIPQLQQYLNLEGHRLAQQNIDLAFKLSGPMKKPTGELAGSPPISVTLMTGGLEVVSEAVRLIDTPRKILFDLLKIGGGILGAAKPQAQP